MRNKISRKAQEKIGALTRAGKTQKEIGGLLRLGRSTVHRYQKKMDLTLPRHGPRTLPLTETQEIEVLTLLNGGKGAQKVARQLGVGERCIRLCAKKHGFHRRPGEPGYRYGTKDITERASVRLSPSIVRKISEEILGHRNFGIDLAWKYQVSYKLILALARKLLGVPQFRPGFADTPLTSNFPPTCKP